MYDIKKAFQFDINAEVAAMVEFLSTRWESVDNVEALLKRIATAAEKNSRSAILDSELSIVLMDLERDRENALKLVDESGGMLKFYDQACLLLEGLQRQVGKVYRHGNDTLSNSYDAAIKGIKKALATPELAQLKRAQPLNLAEMTEHYRENDEAWDAALDHEFDDRKLFKGANTATGGQGGFVSAVSLIMVVQVKDTHNTAPIDQLIRGAYEHFVNVFRAANAHAVLADVKQYCASLSPTQPVFVLNFTPEHSLTKVLYTLAQDSQRGLGKENPEAEYQEAVAEHKNATPLSEEELRTRRADAAGLISKMLKSALKPETPKQAKAREMRDARDRQMVDDIFKSL
jgi:hypothetical protein